MAKIKCANVFVSDMLFAYADKPVRITGAVWDEAAQVIILEIEGEDVPDAPAVQAVLSVETNRARERLHRMRFEPA